MYSVQSLLLNANYQSSGKICTLILNLVLSEAQNYYAKDSLWEVCYHAEKPHWQCMLGLVIFREGSKAPLTTP